MTWQEGLEYAALTDVGMRRKNNQDSHSVVLASDERAWKERGHVLVVADGMGAHAAGELASKLTVDNVPHLYHKHREFSPPEALAKALHETNAEVHRRGQANREFHNMGTTASTLVLLPQGALVAHIGDSRIYRQRGDHLEQLTFDHSLVWELRAAGQMPKDGDLAKLVPKNVITRSVGPNATIQVDLEGPFPLEIGDTFLLCSDGLTGQVTDDELGPILANLPPAEAARVLIDLANLRGGPDNITVLIAKITGPQLAVQGAAAEPLTVGGKRSSGTVHPAVWVVSGVCLLAALVMLIFKSWIIAGIAGMGGAVAILIGLISKAGGSLGGVALQDGRQLGRGPYVSVKCSDVRDFVERLSSIAQDLREAARENDWQIDWSQFNRHCQLAESAAKSSRPGDAVREFARAISHMMKEIRTRKPKNANDSVVDL